MSYFADHLAWQQRVAQEFKASSQFFERAGGMTMTQGFYNPNQDLLGYNSQNSQHKASQDLRRSFNHPLASGQYHPFSQQNLGQQAEPGSVPAINNSFAPGGKSTIITKKDMLRERSLTAAGAAGKQNKVGVKQGLNPYQYMPRSKQMGRRSNTLNKHAAGGPAQQQYQQQLLQQQQQKQQQQNNQTVDVQIPRFNEELETLSVKKSQGPRSIAGHSKHGSKSIAGGARPQTQHGKANLNNTTTSFNKQKILEAVDKLSEKDLEKMSRILKVDDDNQNNRDEEQSNIQDELNDKVDDLNQDNDDLDREETASRVSKASKFSGFNKSEISRLSNKTYIMHLQTELEEEKQARLKLERELDELKKLSSEITSHLGLNKK